MLYLLLLFFFNDTATTEIYTLSLHDALPICSATSRSRPSPRRASGCSTSAAAASTRSAPRSAPAPDSPRWTPRPTRSEEHTSELQSRQYLVCRLLLEKKTIPNMRTSIDSLSN